MAHMDDGTTKVSIRMSGRVRDVDLRETLAEIVAKVGGEVGGHQRAAGARFESTKDAAFIAAAKEVLERKSMEESITV